MSFGTNVLNSGIRDGNVVGLSISNSTSSSCTSSLGSILLLVSKKEFICVLKGGELNQRLPWDCSPDGSTGDAFQYQQGVLLIMTGAEQVRQGGEGQSYQQPASHHVPVLEVNFTEVHLRMAFLHIFCLSTLAMKSIILERRKLPWLVWMPLSDNKNKVPDKLSSDPGKLLIGRV